MAATYGLTPSPNENWLQWNDRNPLQRLEARVRALPWEKEPGKDNDANKVAEPCEAYKIMAERWQVIDDVLGGRSAMLEAAPEYMPPRPFEDQSSYQRRLSRASFTPWYSRLCQAVVSSCTRKPFGWSGVVPKELVPILDDLDLSGNDIEAVARMALFHAVSHGHCGLFVSYPPVPPGLTLAQERELGVRPWVVVVHPRDIIGWRFETTSIEGPEGTRRWGRVLSQLRIRTRQMVPDGDFGEKAEETVQVYERINTDKLGDANATVKYRTFVRTKDDQTGTVTWESDPQRSGELGLNYIPFTILYGQRIDHLVSRPPMHDLAWLNVRHFQCQSDLDHALHLSANPQLCLTGVNLTGGEQVSVGVDEALLFENKDGSAEWIGAPTDGLKAQQERVTEIELQLTKLGLAPMIPIKNLPESGMAKMIERQQSGNLLKSLVRELERAMNEMLWYMGQYVDAQIPSIGLPASFDALALHSQDLLAYSTLQANRQITLTTLLSLLKEGELLPERFDVDAEVKAIEEELQQEAMLMAQQSAMTDPNADPGGSPQALDEAAQQGAVRNGRGDSAGFGVTAKVKPPSAAGKSLRRQQSVNSSAYPDTTADKTKKAKS